MLYYESETPEFIRSSKKTQSWAGIRNSTWKW